MWNSKTVERICDSCARGKSTKFIRRATVKQTHLHQRGQTLKLGNFSNPRDDELSDGDEFDVESYWADHDEHALLTRKYHITVPVGQTRDIARAQPITNTISLMFTDIKGPFKVPGLGGEIYAQSFIEADTKFLRRFYFSYRSEALANLKKLLEVALASESTKLLAYCSDGAPELISRGCVKMLADHGSNEKCIETTKMIYCM